MTRRLVRVLMACGILAAGTSAAAEQIFFKNHRVVEALSHETKGPLIYITLTDDSVVIMKADEVDWEATGRLAQGGVVLRKGMYADEQESEEQRGVPTALTVNELKNYRGASRTRRRRRPLSLSAEIYGRQGWTDSGVNVSPGAPVQLKVSGRITLGRGVSAGAAGLPPTEATGRVVVAGLPFGALIGRIGLAGEPFLVGTSLALYPETSGRLYLCANDADRDDNGGSFDVRMTPILSPSAGGAARTRRQEWSSPPARSPAADHPTWQKGMSRGIGKAMEARKAAEGRQP